MEDVAFKLESECRIFLVFLCMWRGSTSNRSRQLTYRVTQKNGNFWKTQQKLKKSKKKHLLTEI